MQEISSMLAIDSRRYTTEKKSLQTLSYCCFSYRRTVIIYPEIYCVVDIRINNRA
jgi:hypothetical protein